MIKVLMHSSLLRYLISLPDRGYLTPKHIHTLAAMQLYIHTFPCRAEFWEKFKVTDLMAGICKALGELYCTTYKQCDKGKKYAKFKLEWYRKCSLLLLESPAETSNPLYNQWY